MSLTSACKVCYNARMYRTLLLLLLLSACLPLPKESLSDSRRRPPSLEHTLQKGLKEELLERGEGLENWWLVFQDPLLTHLIEKALARHPSLQEALAAVQKVVYEAQIERSVLFPSLQLYGEVDYQHLAKTGFFRAYAPTIPPNVTEYTVGFNLTHTFDFWGKTRRLYGAAIDRTRVQQAESDQAKLILSAAVAVTYFRLQAAMAELSLTTEQSNTLMLLAELVKKRQTHALDSANEVLQAEQARAVAQQALVAARQQVALLEHALLQWLGEGPEEAAPLPLAAPPAPIKVPIPDCLPSDLLACRPDLQAQIWRVEAAAQEVGAAQADFYPNINLQALIGLDTIFIDKLFKTKNVNWSAAPALHLPLFDAGRIKAHWRAKKAALEEEIQAYNQRLIEAAQEVADGLVNLQAAEQRWMWQSDLVGYSLERERLAQQRQSHALGSSLESWQAYLEVVQQKQREVQARQDYYLALIALECALGGGLAQPVPITP